MSRMRGAKTISLVNYPLVVNELFLKTTGLIVFIMLTGLGAFIRIPLFFTPVPVTLQTLFVLLSGAMLGRKFGFFSQAGYITLGVAGVPIFAAASSGLTYLLGPTGGYLFGFMVAAFLVGTVLDKNKTFIQTMAIFLVATIIIWSLGAVWLMFILKVSLSGAIIMGVLPFIAGDLIKLMLAAVLYDRLKFKF